MKERARIDRVAFGQARPHPLGGILEVGATADVTVLDRDPLTTDPEHLARAEVLLTLVGGRMVAEPVRSTITATSEPT